MNETIKNNSKITEESTNEIVICPTNSRYATAFETRTLIHQKEVNKVKKWIDEQIKQVEKLNHNNDDSEKLKLIHNNAIAILGSRGSGKTSFLHTIRHEYEQNKDVIVLDIIDPTLIEEKGHIFLTIIAQIQKEVEKKWEGKYCDDPATDILFWEKKEWENKLLALAKGIPTIDGVGKGLEEWQDPEYIMKKGLDGVRGAGELKKKFSELMQFGLKILDKKAFLLTLDDIDVDFLKGWSVLEVIRKYLSTPYIITVLSGDLKLFSKNIRKQQWLRFGKALLKNEAEQQGRMGSYDSLVTEIESQYIQKVLPPSQRVTLTTLLEKIQINKNFKNDLKVTFDENSEKLKLFEYYKDRLKTLFGIHNPYEQQPMLSFFLGLPIRTQIELLLSIREIPKQKNEVGIEDYSVTNVFLSEFQIKEIDIDLAKANPVFLNIIILKFLLKDKILENCYQIQPSTSDSIQNACLASMSLLFSRTVCNNPYLIFDYFIRIGYTRNLLTTIMPYTEASASIQELCMRTSLFNDHVYRNIMGLINSYIIELEPIIYPDKESRIYNGKSWLGIIPIYSSAEKAKQKRDEDNLKIDEVFQKDDIALWKKQLAYMPLTIAQPSMKQNSSSLYSIYTLFATIGEIIKQQTVQDINLNQTLQDLSQARSYEVPDLKKDKATYRYRDLEDSLERGYSEYISLDKPRYAESPSESEESSEFAKKISDWIEKYPKDYSLSPHLLGKISTRFFYALKNLEKIESTEKLGEAMSFRIIILYNSILVEECRELMFKTDISNDNPNKSSNLFFNNLNKLTREELGSLKFFVWIFKCPLLIPFLDRDYAHNLTETNKSSDSTPQSDWINILLTAIEPGLVNDDTIYSLLNKIQIKRKKQDEKEEKEHKNDLTKFIIKNNQLQRFYIGTNTINRTIHHLKNNKISSEFLMNEDEESVVEKLKPLFASKLDIESFKKFKELIKSNQKEFKSW